MSGPDRDHHRAGLREAFEALRPRLRVRLGEDGRELFDHPDARLASGDLEAAVRFLPEYDNALLGYADRSRVLSAEIPQWTDVGWGSVVVDGFGAARWRLFETRGDARMRIEPFRRLSRAERDGVLEEGTSLARFLRDGEDDTAFEMEPYAP